MSSKTWTLLDVERGLYESDLRITAVDLPGAKGDWSITQRRLQGGLSDGVDLVEIDNGRLRLAVIPTRGMGIWKAELDGQSLGWQSPVRGPVHPKHVPLFEPSGLGWLDGFDEFIVRCGLESNGAPDFDEQGRLTCPLHGRIGNRPAHFVEVVVDESAETITLRGVVEETRFHFQKLRLTASVTTSFNSASFTINDEVENFGGAPAEMQMLYHINIGDPLLVPDDRIVAPVRSIKNRDSAEPGSTDAWEIYGQPVAGDPEKCFFIELLADPAGQTQTLLRNADGTAGTVVKFNTKSLPCFTVWKNEVAIKDGYVTGLEPATNFPNEKSVEKQHGRVVSLPPGETWSVEVTVERLTDAAAVSKVEDAINSMTA